MLSATLQQLAVLTNGTIIGDASTPIHNALPLQDACQGSITLVDHVKHFDKLFDSTAAAVVLEEPLEGCNKPMLIVGDLHQAFTAIVQHLRPKQTRTGQGIQQGAFVHPSAKLGENTIVHAGASVAANVTLGPNCTLYENSHVMEGCTLGEGCTLYPGVTLYEDSQLGDRVLIHAGATIGAFGFGYRQVDGKHIRTSQLGWVELGSDVEIGSGTSIDRGTYGPTKIGEGTKIDNHVQIGHNCHIGRHNLICAQVGVAGSTTTGDFVVLAGQVGISDHLCLADRVIVGAQSGVMNDLEAGSIVVGSPAAPSKRKMLELAMTARLPEMRTELKKLQKQVKLLTSQLDELTASDDQSDRRKAA